MALTRDALIAATLAAAFAAVAQAQVPLAIVADSSLRAFLPRFEEAATRFINGDPTLWLQHASLRDDHTILGAWGGYDRGWQLAGPRYQRVSARIRDTGTRLRVEYISSVVSGDLAYTVTIERSEMQRSDQSAPTPTALRVTQIFRREGGAWKLVHRHADPLMTLAMPDTVPRR